MAGLGGNSTGRRTSAASNYFQWMYDFAELLMIRHGRATIANRRGDARQPRHAGGGQDSPMRNSTRRDTRPVPPRGAADHTAPTCGRDRWPAATSNLRDPAFYHPHPQGRAHHNTGDAWLSTRCTYALPIEDALENITPPSALGSGQRPSATAAATPGGPRRSGTRRCRGRSIRHLN